MERYGRRCPRAAPAVLTALVAMALVLPPGPAGGATNLPARQASSFSLITEPADGLSAIYAFMRSARRSLDMTMYELADPVAEAALAADAKRGVVVRVVLDQNLARAVNTPAYDYLVAHGVKAHWAPTSYDVTHQKTITVDHRASLVMTLNLTSQYYASSRDFALLDTTPADVAAIEAVFADDFAGRMSSAEPSGADLIWSPGADARLVSLIGSARHALYVENEEISEYTIVDALAAAARRGVGVDLVMTYQSSWRSHLDELAGAGVHVRTYAAAAPLYIHAKVIVVDPGYADERLEIGSQNFSWASLQYNRELGVVLGPKDAGIIGAVAAVVRSDYAGGTPWAG